MTKHRDLAQHDTSSRIWRTVVVAGAMLGCPLIAAAEAPPPAAKTAPNAAPAPASKPAPPPPTKAELANQAAEVVKALAAEMVELDKKISASLTEVKNAKDQRARDTANLVLKDQQKQKTELKAKQTTAKAEQKKADTAAKSEASANKPKPRPRTPTSTLDEFRPKGRGFILS